MKEIIEECLRHIHYAGGMPTEQTIDITDASPRSRLTALRAAISGVHLITPPSRRVRNVNHSVCLMP
jgi:hypothetical protein